MAELPYKILDADNHFTQPPTLYQDYIDPSKRDLAITHVTDDKGQLVQLFAGSRQVHDGGLRRGHRRGAGDQGRRHQRRRGWLQAAGPPAQPPQPLKGLSDEEKSHLAVPAPVRRSATATCASPSWTSRASRPRSCSRRPPTTSSSSSPTTSKPCTPTSARSTGGCTRRSAATDNRMFLPPYIALADVDLALKELEIIIETGSARCSRSSRATPTASVTTPSAAGRRPTDVRSDLESGERGRPPPGRAPRGHRLPEVRGRLVGGRGPDLRPVQQLPVDDVLG